MPNRASPSKTAPGRRTLAAIEKATRATDARPARASLQWEETPEGYKVAAAPHSDDAGNGNQMLNAFGTASPAFMLRNFTSLETAVRGRADDRGAEAESINAALALMEAVAPQDELEGALAVQMASNHALTMEMLCRAKSTGDVDQLAMYANLAVKLQRTFTAQIEALARMRGKGQQTVRVEHVTVQAGAQAIVGDVHHHPRGMPGGEIKSEEQPYEPAPSAAIAQGGKTLPSPDAARDGMPITRHAERPVPHPRREVARRAPRKSERA